jgi:hypothetical protein
LESVGKVFFSNISRQDASDKSPQTPFEPKVEEEEYSNSLDKELRFFFLLLCVLCASAPLREPLFRGFLQTLAPLC